MNPILAAAGAVSLIGAGLAAWISYIHAQLSSQGDSYTSFCNVNATVNCDAVLGSAFANVWGIPVAWMALVAYLGLAGLFFLAARSPIADRKRFLTPAAIGVTGSVVFSLYMVLVSAFVLETVCLMCTGLYAVVAVLAVLTAVAIRRHQAERAADTPVLSWATAALPVLATAGFAAAAAVSTPTANAPVGTATTPLETMAEVKARDPEFYNWYTALKVDRNARQLSAELGRRDVPVRILEFSDFECGHCRRNFEILKQLEHRRPDAFEVIHKHFPLDKACNKALSRSFHENACRAAEAAECAGAQGRYSEMAEALFLNQRSLSEARILELGSIAGVETGAFEKCLSSGAMRDAVVQDCRAGRRLKVNSTPTLYLNGRKLPGAFQSVETFEAAISIESELAD